VRCAFQLFYRATYTGPPDASYNLSAYLNVNGEKRPDSVVYEGRIMDNDYEERCLVTDEYIELPAGTHTLNVEYDATLTGITLVTNVLHRNVSWVALSTDTGEVGTRASDSK
jgi:hypothetical protein